MDEVMQAADELIAAIRRTEVYKHYDTLKEQVEGDPVNRELLRRFTHAQSALQMAALSGAEPKPEDAAEFEKLSTLAYAHADLTDYLLAQMRVQQLVAQTMERLTNAVGLSIDLPEM